MFKKFLAAFAVLLLLSCTKESVQYLEPEITYKRDTVITEAGQTRFTHEDVIICNEGNWQQNDGQLSVYNGYTNTLTNKWFRKVNGFKLGDTPSDIIQVNDTLIAIAVNWSNIIQFIHPDGTACGATENVPNNRRLCVDDEGYLYVTSYAHECGTTKFTKGYVAKVDVVTKQVIGTCEVGWEPEGIRFYNGKLFVANTGGYAFSESHDYENSISVIDAKTMVKEKDVELVADLDGDGISDRVINLYGEMSQCGQYLCINSPGDYYTIPASTTIFNCEDNTYKVFNFPCTYNTVYDNKFATVGSAFSYLTGGYEFYIKTIDPSTNEVTDGIISDEVSECIKSMQAPYEIYVSPYTNSIYLTDASSHANAGYLYAFDKNGSRFINKEQLYLCPAHMIAIPHYVTDPVYTTTIIITPVINYPKTKSSINTIDINQYHREKFVESWSVSRK